MPQKPKKKFDKLGFGALALYVAVMVVLGGAVYGVNVSTIMMSLNRSDRARAQLQSGHMVIITEDRTQCRTVRFNNETAELSRETLTDCEGRIGSGTGGSYSIFRDGFSNR
jgi:hypothetical protein